MAVVQGWYLRTHDTIAVSASSRTMSSLFGEDPTHASRTALGCPMHDVRPTLSSLLLFATHSNEETAHIYNQRSDEREQQQHRMHDDVDCSGEIVESSCRGSEKKAHDRKLKLNKKKEKKQRARKLHLLFAAFLIPPTAKRGGGER